MFDAETVATILEGNAVHLVLSVPTPPGQVEIRSRDLAESINRGSAAQASALRAIADDIQAKGTHIPMCVFVGGQNIFDLKPVEVR
jgi:hypothetical protein